MNGNALEALNGIKKAFASHLVRQVGNTVKDYTFAKALEALNYDTDLQTIESALTELEEIKARGEQVIDNLRAVDVPSTHKEVQDRINSYNYILKGEKK